VILVVTSAKKLIIFCPTCDRLILDEAGCASCGWQRPLVGADPGTVLWQASLPGRLGEPYSLPAISHDLLLAGLEPGLRSGLPQGAVLALDLATGRERWRYSLAEGRFIQAPVAAGEVILLASQDIKPLPRPDNALIALDHNGELAWQFPVPAHSLSAPAVYGDRLFITTSSGTGYIVALPDGRLHHRVNYLPGWTPAPPTVGDNTFYIGSREPVIAAVTAADGQSSILFRAEPDDVWFMSAPAFDQEIVYAAGTDKHLYAIDARAGRLRWRVRLGRGASSPPVIGKHLYVGVKEQSENNQFAYALYALSLATGEQIWRFESDKHIEAPVLASHDFVFAGSRGGCFYALDAHTGAVQWQLQLEDKIVTAPVLAGDKLVFGTRAGQIVAVAWGQAPTSGELLAPDAYRAKGDWEMAGISAALAGQWLAAAADFERLNKPAYVAQLYERAGAWQQAADTYRLAHELHQAITAYRMAGNKAAEAAVRLELNDFALAAELYESALMYAEAASAYADAGLMAQAARCYAQAGQLQPAAELYLGLNEPALAAELYQQLGDTDKAVVILQEAGLTAAAARLLVSNKRYIEAVRLLEEAQLVEDAAAIWQELADWNAAAQVYHRAQQWSRAAEMYLQANNLEEAARLYRQDNQLSRAAALYIRLKAPQQALALYRQIEDATEVARLAEQNQDWLNAANAYLIMRPPRPREAARCFQQAQEWTQAAQLLAQAGDPDQAVPLWLQAGQPEQAVELLLQSGRPAEAARLWEENGRYNEAAEIWREQGDIAEAIRLYEQAGNTTKVLDLIESQGDWQRLRHMAHQLCEYEREALACVRLLDTAQPGEMVEFHLKAAQAFRQAGELSEQQKRRQVVEMADLWQEAAVHYDHAFEPEKAAECRHNVNRLRRWPDLLVQIAAGQVLVAGEWHILSAKITNVGFGVAPAITVRVHSDHFGGDDLATQQIRGLRAGHSVELSLRVQPKRKAVGVAVPLDFEVAYLRLDGTLVTRNISAQVAVRRPDSPVTPMAPLPDTPKLATPANLQIYGGNRTALHALLTNHFSVAELRSLCFALNVEYEDLEATGRPDKARELITYLERRGRLNELITLCRQERPHLAWE
jgi:outer membrane protein assembly factor BamB/tetratricopeptide (TPR) repeat protein